MRTHRYQDRALPRKKKPGPKRTVGHPKTKRSRIADRDQKRQQRLFRQSIGLVEVRGFVTPKHREWFLAQSRSDVAEAELRAATASGDQLTILQAEKRLDLVKAALREAHNDQERQQALTHAQRDAAEKRRAEMLAGAARLREAELIERAKLSVELPKNIIPPSQAHPEGARTPQAPRRPMTEREFQEAMKAAALLRTTPTIGVI